MQSKVSYQLQTKMSAEEARNRSDDCTGENQNRYFVKEIGRYVCEHEYSLLLRTLRRRNNSNEILNKPIGVRV